jgi:hypothetical protein
MLAQLSAPPTRKRFVEYPFYGPQFSIFKASDPERIRVGPQPGELSLGKVPGGPLPGRDRRSQLAAPADMLPQLAIANGPQARQFRPQVRALVEPAHLGEETGRHHFLEPCIDAGVQRAAVKWHQSK